MVFNATFINISAIIVAVSFIGGGNRYVIKIKFVSDLCQISDFLWVHWFPPPIKLTATIIAEILMKVALNTINQTNH
jgi:hypothetical protein